jgi:hypothetical protein
MESTMFKKMLISFGAAAATLGSGLALAHPPHWAPAYGYRAHHRMYYGPSYYAPRPVYVVPAPRYVYAPPPPVAYPYYAAPVVVAPAPAAVVAAPIAPGVSIRFRVPL